jgi:hypothetical protein
MKKILEGRAKEVVEDWSIREPRMIELLLDTLKKEYGDVQYLSGEMRKLKSVKICPLPAGGARGS